MDVYVDDMLVKSKETRSHLEDLEETVAMLRKYRLKLNLGKNARLVKTVPGDTVYLCISSTSQTVNSMLVREEDGAQTPMYYVSKVLNGAECRYPSIEKMALDLVVTSRKFLPRRGQNEYSPKVSPRQTRTFGRLLKWAIELSEYDISFLPRTTIKTQALVDFVSEMTGTT
ncbi:hypothetical protein Sango_0472800 [Sesamum angolense]|uniref:Reverse transcriptase domain-containing protein n=1 Tax=Sesamum angolense TaxID=2727404 RepID=A0AAE2C4P7_9LAMI|nr:hypothetical protein Sango_0472800 [Sesamum angolense]